MQRSTTTFLRSGLAPDVWVDTRHPKTVCSTSLGARPRAALASCSLLWPEPSGLSRAKQVVVVGDGAPWIWKLVAEHFPGAIQIVDLYHAQQYVWEVVHAVFGRSSQDACIWAKQACTRHGSWQDRGTRGCSWQAPHNPPAPTEIRSVPEKAADYFTTNAEWMCYPSFRAQGIHVGSGIAEAACKTLVDTRTKRTGMRWTPNRLDTVLSLRTAKLDHTYDEFWEYQSRLVA